MTIARPKILLILTVCAFLSLLPGCGKKAAKPHILLITIDTLRADRLGCYGCPRDTSPFIDSLARNGVMFRNAITPLPLTDPSHATILTSLHPVTHRVTRNSRKLDDKVETIAEVLKKNGYYTMGAVAVRHLSGKYNFSQGFDAFADKWDPRFKDWIRKVSSFDGRHQRVAGSVHRDVKRMLDNYLSGHKEKPFFIWVHYYDPHYPYINRRDVELEKPLVKKIFRAYDKEIRYTDGYIEKLYRYLEEKGLTTRMITCITSDHGEQFGEHGATYGHPDFYSENTFVPLIFHGPGIPRNIIVDRYVSSMDIAVSLLKLANLEFDQPVQGIPLPGLPGNNGHTGDREFLVLGDPIHVRSMQLISDPHAFILNFDFFYKHCFISFNSLLPEDRFKQVPEKWLKLITDETTGDKEIRIDFPYTLRRGRNYLAIRVDLAGGSDVTAGYKLSDHKWSEGSLLKSDGGGTATVYLPVTPIDGITAYFTFKKNGDIKNPRYSFVPEKVFQGISNSMTRVENKRIFNALKTPRKNFRRNELFNLTTDFAMKDNLVKFKQHRARVVEGTNTIYRLLESHLKRARQLLGKRKKPKPLTEKEKEMLKSLGYL